MSNIYFKIFSFLLFASPAFANMGEKEGLLWKITGNGLEHPSYLFGTMHNSVDSSFLDKVVGFETAFKSVNCLILEMDTTGLYKSRKSANSFLPDSIKYTNLLPKEELRVLDSIMMKYLSIDSEKTSLLPHLLYRRIGSKMIVPQVSQAEMERVQLSNLPLNLTLMNKAIEKNYKVVGFENMKQIIDMKFNAPLEQEAKELMCKLRNHNELTIANINIFQAYLKQNLVEIGKNSDLYDKLSCRDYIGVNTTSGRNLKWMEKIPSLIKKSPCLIAVGAAHLSSHYGLIKLLRQQGYTVEPVK